MEKTPKTFPLNGVRKIVVFLFEATEGVRESANSASPRSYCEGLVREQG